MQREKGFPSLGISLFDICKTRQSRFDHGVLYKEGGNETEKKGTACLFPAEKIKQIEIKLVEYVSEYMSTPNFGPALQD